MVKRQRMRGQPLAASEIAEIRTVAAKVFAECGFYNKLAIQRGVSFGTDRATIAKILSQPEAEAAQVHEMRTEAQPSLAAAVLAVISRQSASVKELAFQLQARPSEVMAALETMPDAAEDDAGRWRVKEATPVEDPLPLSVQRLKRENERLKKDNAELLKQHEENEKLFQMFGFIKEAKMDIPEWTRKAPSQGNKRQAIPTALFSDWHFDEVVNPAQINYVNEYNRPIAEKRLENFFHNTIELSTDYLQGLKYEGLVLPISGDIFSGIIHEELVETNAATIFESMLFWAEPMCAGIRLLRDAFGRVFVPSVVGNHGRYHRKPRAKNRAQDNFDWFFAHLLRKLLADEKGISFMISEAADVTYNVFSTVYLSTHGDQFKGGSGIAGLLSPLMIGDARKRKREAAINRPYHFMHMGHWHQLGHVKGLIINGSGKGYDEYAMVSNFDYEPPQQAFWITDPIHGKTIDAPIHLIGKDEKYKGGLSSVLTEQNDVLSQWRQAA